MLVHLVNIFFYQSFPYGISERVLCGAYVWEPTYKTREKEYNWTRHFGAVQI